MAYSFNRGEAVYCWRNVKDQAGNYVDPQTSFKITITDPSGTVLVNGVDILATGKLELGKFYYNYVLPADAERGYYLVKWVTLDGILPTVKPVGFYVV